MSGPTVPGWREAGVLVGILLGGAGIHLLLPALRLPLSALLSGALTVLVLVVGMLTRAASPRLAIERWVSSLPLSEDLGTPSAWPATAWSTATLSGERQVRYLELIVSGRPLRVFQGLSFGRFTATIVRWQGRSGWETPPVTECGEGDCTRPNGFDVPIRVRRDAERGLWVIDQGDRLHSTVFTDGGDRVELTYASILSSAAPPRSWVVGAWGAALLAFASMQWSRRRSVNDVLAGLPYRAPAAPLDVSADDLHYRALLPHALALTICALHAAPLAAYFLHAFTG